MHAKAAGSSPAGGKMWWKRWMGHKCSTSSWCDLGNAKSARQVGRVVKAMDLKSIPKWVAGSNPASDELWNTMYQPPRGVFWVMPIDTSYRARVV